MVLEDRLRRLEDLQHIRDLLIRYGDRFDRRDLKEWSELFSPEGEWHLPEMKAVDGPRSIQLLGSQFGTEPFGACHVIRNPTIAIRNDRARVNSVGLALKPGPRGVPSQYLISYYVDDLVRSRDGEWFFDCRRCYLDLPDYLSPAVGPPSLIEWERSSGGPRAEPNEVGESRSLDMRLRELEDREAIGVLLQQHAVRLDRADFAYWSRLFAEDGEFHGQRMSGVGGPTGVLEMMRSYADGGTAPYRENEPKGRCHLMTNGIVNLRGNRAEATSTSLVLNPGMDSNPQIVLLSYYVDDLVAGKGGDWLFGVRRDYSNLPGYMCDPIGPPQPDRGTDPIVAQPVGRRGDAGERLAHLEDIEAISGLILEYAHLLDRRDLLGLSHLFSEGGELHGEMRDFTGGPDGVYAGLDGMFRERAPAVGDVHLVFNPEIAVTDCQAHASSVSLVLRPGERDRTPVVKEVVYYEDELVRPEDRDWRFQARRVYRRLPPYLSSTLGT